MLDKDSILSYSRDYKVRFFRCPDLVYQIVLMFLISLIPLSVIYSIEIQVLIESSILFFFPALISAFLLPHLADYREELNFRQSAMLSLVSLLIIVPLVFLFNLLLFSGLSLSRILIVSTAVPIGARYLILRSSFIPDFNRPLLPAFFQSLISVPLIHLIFPLSVLDLVAFIAVSLIAVLPIIFIIHYLNKPIRENFGIPTMEMMTIVLKLLKGRSEGARELEETFSHNSIKADIGYTLFSFRRTGDHSEKALFVIPGVHPGPLKGIGGARLPIILSDELKEHGDVFPFHSASTHLLNPVKEKYCYEIAEEIDEKLKQSKVEYINKASHYIGKGEEGFIGAQKLGSGLLVSGSFSPLPTEDIESPIARIFSERAERKGHPRMGFVDSHNCVKRNCSEVYYPSRRYNILSDRFDEVLDMADDIEGIGEIKLGTASKKGYSEGDISEEGIKVAVTQVNGEKNAQILIDGNNMCQGVREGILDNISDLVSLSEVHTTDTHEVNELTRDYLPIGYETDDKELIEEIRELTKEAIEDLEPVEVGFLEGKIKDFEVMGPINKNRLDTISETLYKMVPLAASLGFTVQALATILFLTLLP